MTNILHFVLNITGNTSNDFLEKLQMSGEVFSFQAEVYSVRASISPQSPSSLDPAFHVDIIIQLLCIRNT